MSDGSLSRITLPMFYVLLSLLEEKSYGYAIGQEVAERSEGTVDMPPASLYWTLSRLEEAGLIVEVEGPSAEEVDDGRAARRRYYALTEAGQATLEEETATWQRVLEFARSRNVGQENR